VVEKASETQGGLVLSLPKDLAGELLDQGEVVPFLRESRTDPTLVSAVIVSAATAATTVLITMFTSASARRIGDAIRRYFKDRDTSGTVELIIERDGAKQVQRLTVNTTLDRADDIVRLLELGVQHNLESTRQDDAQ
jgi:hypothetical protein